MTDNSHQLTDPEHIKRFVFAGRAVLTIVSKLTGKHFTYRITKPKQEGAVSHFVAVLTGPSNTDDYTYLGHYYTRDGSYTHGRKSALSHESPSAMAWRYFNGVVLNAGIIPEELEVYHEGHCARCGRVLTVPASIESGIGPECADKMGM